MVYALIITVILVLYLFNYLNHKIRKLEREISGLKKASAGNSADEIREIKQAPQAEAESSVSDFQEYHPIEPAVLLQPADGPGQDQKDRVSMVFEFLKQNALTITGIFTLVLGIGYFVKYAIDRNWLGETSRAGIGFLAGAVMVVISYFLRKNYSVFSSIVTGGGIAVFYFTATIGFREYHLFSQNTAFSVMCLITLASLSLSYYYKSEILMIFSLAGGFLAPLMISTGDSNYLFLFTYITVLNIGMLATAFVKNWKSVGWIAFVFTHIYLLFWTVEKTEFSGLYFYLASYVIFYAFALRDYFTRNLLSSSDILMLVLVNFTGLTGLVYIFNALQYGPVIIFPAGFALVNLVLLFREYSRKDFGTAYSAFTGITAGLITTAIALQFQAHLMTSVWAVEATLLLFIWKKTGHPVFRSAFYVLFPLVVLAQIISWTRYRDAGNLAVIFNPVFLTSSVTVVTTCVNLMVLRKHAANDKSGHFFENTFALISYIIIYMAFLLEILYHISGRPQTVLFSIALLFSICYIFLLLVFRKKLRINTLPERSLLYMFLVLVIINTSAAGSGIVSDYFLKKIPAGFYAVYLLYIIPFVYTAVKILPAAGFFKTRLSYWLAAGTAVTAASFELYHLYAVFNADTGSGLAQLGRHFSLLYLPIIWAVAAILLIYKGLSSHDTEYNRIGFSLLALMILKLYAYDVWEMDNVSRIIAFIILGILLLFSSLIFQRLKKIIGNLLEKKNEHSQENHTE
ncbi:DUF2339 domain-containing protein [Chryseobacterium gregarium]|uniref:DUF2339 domain-containing protein n=1 Tax=Chryseobacterium gregarium TaxID=456299 RepID=UPI0003F4BDEE|nr:DUF2339 domain-containing protein [Chryseobacterium gregarium]